jgi:N-acetyl-anhydromuramyl-L-alanine amidase AmpD
VGARRRKNYDETLRRLAALTTVVAGIFIIWWILKSVPPAAAPLDPAWLPANPSSKWECIVIHHSATDVGGAARFDKAHRAKGWDELGYHFVIGNGSDTPDGTVEVGPRWKEQKHGAHCKTPDEYYNEHGIGICLVGNFDNYDPTGPQMRSLATLCAFLSKRFHISTDHIFTHGGITGKTDCPGKRFDLTKFRAAMTASLH